MIKSVARTLCFAFMGGACSIVVSGAQPLDGTALVRHAPTLNGSVEGSIHQMTAENTALNSGASISGNLLIPGTPTVRVNGNPIYGGTLDGSGTTLPTSHKVTLNSGASLGRVIRQVNAVPLPTVSAPSQPAGLRSVSLNHSSQSPGDFSTLRNLTLNSNVGRIVVPPGTYGNFNANSGSGFILGSLGAATASVYNFQNLTLNSNSTFTVVGPVILTLNSGFSTNTDMGASEHPEWLKLRIAGGGLSLAGNKSVYAELEAPNGTLTLNGGSQLVGSLACDRLIVNSNAFLRLVAAASSMLDADHDGMDDSWETANGLNPQFNDADLDNDGDGLSNLTEFQQGLSSRNPDSDEDGLYDGDEVSLGRNPAIPSPDSQPPTTPANLATNAVTANSVTLSWEPATDNLKVSGYLIYRDGQPIETDIAIRGTTFTDSNLPDGEEFAYQVRSFDYAGNLSPLSAEVIITTVGTDSDGDGISDEWELEYFGEDNAMPQADSDGDGLTNLQEFKAGSNPKDFFNGVPTTLEKLSSSGSGPYEEVVTLVRKPDGTPWPNAPVNFNVTKGTRRFSATPGGPDYVYQLQVRADTSGTARVYLEPLLP